MNILSHADQSAPARRQIDTMEGEAYSILAVATRSSIFPDCLCHDIKIGRGTYSKTLVIHAKGIAPLVGADARRKRMGGNGVALIWCDASGKVTGGGFTTAAVPADWRVPAKVSERAARAAQVAEANEAKAENPTGFQGKVNVYVCDACGHDTVTIDADVGVTPFMIGCTAEGCTGTAKSMMYRVPLDLVPTHEWFRPVDMDGYTPMVRQHVEMGGLVMRPRAA